MVFPSSIAAAGLAAMFFSTGSAIGINANLISRQNKFAVIVPAVIPGAKKDMTPNSCPRCRTPAKPEYAFCINCGFRLG
jgi:hypothetical protein